MAAIKYLYTFKISTRFKRGEGGGEPDSDLVDCHLQVHFEPNLTHIAIANVTANYINYNGRQVCVCVKECVYMCVCV